MTAHKRGSTYGKARRNVTLFAYTEAAEVQADAAAHTHTEQRDPAPAAAWSIKPARLDFS